MSMTSPATATPLTQGAAKFRQRMLNPVLTRAYFFAKLPLAWFAGLRIRELTDTRCAVVVPRGWRTQNPFASTYFAAQSMAAELSTGALAMAVVRAAPEPVSMLIVGLDAEFGKKATADATFVCEDGARLADGVREAIASGEAVSVTAESVGRLADGTEVSRFRFTWSFKKKSG
jgi:hypothetical protein